MTIEELLSEPDLAGMTILAGQVGASRTIETAQTIETQIIGRYHQPAMLYILDNQNLIQSSHQLQLLLHQLADTNAAGLAIMPNQMQYMTQTVQRLAQQLALPIIVMPQMPSFSDGMQLFFEAMINYHTLQLRQVIQNNQRLADLVLDTHDVNRVLELGAQIMGTPIILLDSHFKAIFTSRALINQQDLLTSFFRNSGINYFQLEEEMTVDADDYSFTLFPLFPAYKENKAFVGIQNYDDQNEYVVILRQLIMNTMSFVNSRIDMVNESNFRNRSGFFLSVLDGGISQDLLEHRLSDMSIAPTTKFVCAITDVVTDDPNRMVHYQLLDQVQQLVMWFINEFTAQTVQVFSWHQQLVLLIDETENAQHVVSALQQFIQEKIPTTFRFVVGYSQSHELLGNLKQIFQEAQEANRTSLQDPQHSVSRYQPKLVNELVSLIPSDEAQTFYHAQLDALLNYEHQDEAQELLETLKRYFYFGQQVSQTAKSMFLHRNTVLYRLKKAQVILDVDLNDPQVAQNLQFALLLNVAD